MSKHTPGPWTSRALGGHSVVLCPTLPGRNDSRAKVGYGYRDEAFSIAYPFLDDDDRVRMDFVCFSHDDARLIAAAPDLLIALAEELENVEDDIRWAEGGELDRLITRREKLEAVIAKAGAQS